MQIFIQSPGGVATAYQVEADTSVENLKSMIENYEFIPSNLFRLVNGTATLTGGLLCNHDVEDEDTLAMMMNVEGGSYHGSPSILQFCNLVASEPFRAKLFLKAQIVEVEVTWYLSTLSSEIVATVANAFSFSKANKRKNGSEYVWLLCGKHSQRFCPIGLYRGSWKMPA